MAENLEFVNKTFKFSNKSVQVIKDSFGPNGLDTLVSTTSGTLMLTNDGFHVLKSLSSGCPVGRLLFQGLALFYKNTGDFSKKFVLLAREILDEVLHVLSVDKETASEQILCISRGMDGLCYSLPSVFDKLQTMGVVYNECSEKIEYLQNSVISIMKTTIVGKFSPKTCEILVGLLQQLIFVDEGSYHVAQLRQKTDKLLCSFSDTVWEVPGKPLTMSVILPGIIIPREFLTMVKKLPRSSEDNSFKFIILAASLGYDLPQSDSVLVLKDSQHVTSVLEWKGNYIENVVKMLANNGIELIITSVTLHETFIHICNQYHIALIHLIPQEDITRISNVFCISVIFDLDSDLTPCIGVATSCKSIQVGRHLYVYLEPAKTLVKQIILHAPTEALCHQYSTALQNMLKILRSSFKENPDNSFVLSYVTGGGAFELALTFALEEYRKLNKFNPNSKLACQILEKALLCIPRQLAENSDCRLTIFDLKTRTKQALTTGKHMIGLDRTGNLSLLREEGIIEPTTANFSLITSVLQLIIQILRTDKVIHVKTLPFKNLSIESEDSDCDIDD